MDREVKEQYQVLIQAKDMGGQLGGLAGTTTVNITLSDVNDNPPRFSKSKSSVWSEKKKNYHGPVDKGATFRYQLVILCLCHCVSMTNKSSRNHRREQETM